MVRKVLFSIVIAIAFLLGYLFNTWINYTEKTNFTSLEQNVVSFKPANKEPDPQDNELNNKYDPQENKFSDEDLKTFKLIKGFYKDFKYSDKYTVTSEDEKKMVFSKENNLYFDTFVSYDVIYAGNDMVNYWFDAGATYSGHGSYYVIDDDTVIKIEKVIGSSAYSYEISKNGVTIESKTRECDHWGNPID